MLIETISVPIGGGSALSTAVLDAGASYRLEASGTFTIGGPGDGLADAEYADFSNPPGSVIDFTAGGLDLGISVNDDPPGWGAFSPDHVYNIAIVGEGLPISVGYRDSNYGDNSGELTLRIFLVGPGPCNDADLAQPFGLLDLADLTAFVSAFLAMTPPADMNGDGLYDLADVTRFVGAFLAGCP